MEFSCCGSLESGADELFFPDRWEPSEAGRADPGAAAPDLRRPGELGVAVHLYTNEADLRELDARGGARSRSHEGAAAWFAGIQRGVCLFGADPSCEAPLGPRDSTCPGCGGSVMGEIRDSQDRLAAEDALPAASVEEEHR